MIEEDGQVRIIHGKEGTAGWVIHILSWEKHTKLLTFTYLDYEKYCESCKDLSVTPYPVHVQVDLNLLKNMAKDVGDISDIFYSSRPTSEDFKIKARHKLNGVKHALDRLINYSGHDLTEEEI